VGWVPGSHFRSCDRITADLRAWHPLGFTLRTYVHGLEEAERDAATKFANLVANTD